MLKMYVCPISFFNVCFFTSILCFAAWMTPVYVSQKPRSAFIANWHQMLFLKKTERAIIK